jgi:hypothetical protein
MNWINKLIILTIIVILINKLLDGKFNDFLSRIFKIENFFGVNYKNNDNDNYPKYPTKPYSDDRMNKYSKNLDLNNLDDESFNLYRFLNNLVSPNYYDNITISHQKIKATTTFEENILYLLNKILNSRGYKFDKIKLLVPVYYYENKFGKQMLPFKISSEVSYQGKFIGITTIYLETFLRINNNNIKNNDYLAILNVKIMERIVPSDYQSILSKNYSLDNNFIIPYMNQPQTIMAPPDYFSSKIESLNENDNNKSKSIFENKNLDDKLNEGFTNNVSIEKFEDLFIIPPNLNKGNNPDNKDNEYFNQTDNDLIPSIIDVDN